MKKKRIAARAVCLIIAGVILTGALTVAAVMGSPYETLKNAVFDALMLDNFTVVGEVSLTINGRIEESDRMHEAKGGGSSFSYSFDKHGVQSGWTYTEDGLTVGTLDIFDGIQWYYARTSGARTTLPGGSMLNPITGGMLTPEDRASAQFRLMELAIDLLVGDLKNNFTMTQQGGGVRRVNAAFTESQLPEIIRVFRDVMIEEQLRWYNGDYGNREDFGDPMHAPMRSMSIDRVQITADVDSDGNLIYLNAGATLTATTVFGDANLIEIGIVTSFTDIGTTVPEIPIPGARELLTEVLDRNRPTATTWFSEVFFTRNADGSINLDSIMPEHPRWRTTLPIGPDDFWRPSSAFEPEEVLDEMYDVAELETA